MIDDDVWLPVCELADLVPESGAVALVGSEQVAIFRTHDGQLYAVQQLDPYSGAMVLSRGIVGTRGGVPTVASPMFKQVFDLRTGECLDTAGEEPSCLRTWPVTVARGTVLVRPAPDSGGEP